MSARNKTESDAADGDKEPSVDATEVRDFFVDEEEPLGVSDISREFDISDDEAREHLDRLLQSGILRRNARRASSGGDLWVLEYPHLRVRSAKEVANESPLAYRANLAGEPRDQEVGIEDVLELLADFETNRANLSTTRAAAKLQITPRFARDLLDELAERGVAGRREVEPVRSTGSGAANMYWLSDEYTPADVEALLGDPEPEIDPTERLNEAIND